MCVPFGPTGWTCDYCDTINYLGCDCEGCGCAEPDYDNDYDEDEDE